MDWIQIAAKLYSLVLLAVGGLLVYMSISSKSELLEFWLYFAGIGIVFMLMGLIGLILKFKRGGII